MLVQRQRGLRVEQIEQLTNSQILLKSPRSASENSAKVVHFQELADAFGGSNIESKFEKRTCRPRDLNPPCRDQRLP